MIPSNGEETLDTFIGLCETDAAQDDERSCDSEQTHPKDGAEPQCPSAAPHEGECSGQRLPTF